jgi:hypothetical protein
MPSTGNNLATGDNDGTNSGIRVCPVDTLARLANCLAHESFVNRHQNHAQH